jgi:hypothetical protein
MKRLKTWTSLRSILDRSDLPFQHGRACLNGGSYSNFMNICDRNGQLDLNASSSTTKGFALYPRLLAYPTDPYRSPTFIFLRVFFCV